jgi:muconolactone delta-isomerase
VKFLVIWKLELSLLSPHVAAAVARMPAYAKPLEQSGQIASRYHIVGAHGGAWLYNVSSNEELERLIALMPIYNFAHYTIYPLADMPDWDQPPAPLPTGPIPAPYRLGPRPATDRPDPRLLQTGLIPAPYRPARCAP